MNNRFIWEDGELVSVSSEDLNKMGAVYYKNENQISCPFCDTNKYCQKKCEKYQRLATEIADSILDKMVQENEDASTQFGDIFSNLIALSKDLLPPGTILTKGLFSCIQIQFIRLVQTETEIVVPQEIIDKLQQGSING